MLNENVRIMINYKEFSNAGIKALIKYQIRVYFLKIPLVAIKT